MLLQQLFNFQWLNEPQGVFFLDSGMKVVAEPETSFWQNKKLKINRDNGHFFYATKDSDFLLTVKWDIITRPALAENGLMLRIDKENWAKIFAKWDENGKNKIYVSVTNLGFSDLNELELDYSETKIWFKAKRQFDNIELLYSKDGDNYQSLREFTFIDSQKELDIGAYICCPNKNEFDAVLSNINIA